MCRRTAWPPPHKLKTYLCVFYYNYCQHIHKCTLLHGAKEKSFFFCECLSNSLKLPQQSRRLTHWRGISCVTLPPSSVWHPVLQRFGYFSFCTTSPIQAAKVKLWLECQSHRNVSCRVALLTVKCAGVKQWRDGPLFVRAEVVSCVCTSEPGESSSGMSLPHPPLFFSLSILSICSLEFPASSDVSVVERRSLRPCVVWRIRRERVKTLTPSAAHPQDATKPACLLSVGKLK